MPTGSEENVGTVVAFAKWSHPIYPDEDYVEPPWIWPEDTDFETLRAWTAKAADAESRSIRGVPCYRACPYLSRASQGIPPLGAYLEPGC